MIPPFNAVGNSPPGIHTTAWSEFSTRFGVSPRRTQLLVGLRTTREARSIAECQTAYNGGSFVTKTVDPGDFDRISNV